MAKKLSSFYEVGEIRPARDSDFQHFINLIDDGKWTQKMDKDGIIAWARNMENTSIKMFKVHTVFMDVSAETVFDVVMDTDYRSTWDDSAIRDFDMCKIDGCNDIGYYALKCPAPLKNRDYVNQRSWRVVPGQHYIVFNHSVSHKMQPPLKNFIRGVSYVTGFFIKPSAEGSSLTYITQSDPKGKIPKWVINFALYKLSPKILKTLHRACLKYTDWKASNSPEFKPWLNPEQNTLPLYSSEDQVTQSLVPQQDEDDVNVLNTVPEGMEVYDTMDTNEELFVINGVSDALT